jgi:Rps23 Pro-64 3,4-dihydroxylase Tpa1-like proline 4-hydroxylase
LVQELIQTFLSKKAVEKLMHILSQTNNGVDLAPQELSDLFVTQYSTGDFLSPHNDGISGTFAFVVSLMDGPPNRKWQDDLGGTLRFQYETANTQVQNPHPHPGNWCEVLTPTFNTAIFFQTRGSHGGIGPMHEALPVAYRAELEGFRRFGVTGWYMDRKDNMSESTKAERDKMRAK